MAEQKKKSTPRGASRRALAERVMSASRESSTAGVMLHAALAEQLGLSPTDHKALEVLDRLGPRTAGEIAEHTGLAAASVTSLVDRLEEKGLVRRERDATDRRRVNVVPTGANDVRLREMLGPVHDVVEHVLRRYDDHQLEAIADFLSTGAAWARERTARLAKKK